MSLKQTLLDYFPDLSMKGMVIVKEKDLRELTKDVEELRKNGLRYIIHNFKENESK